ncbi:hypothetical protein [Streptomyces sp. NPDC101776]|uniref:hypothetical protein n=1 Tax=Streptomyces sp. NPDC101776 TaxID=3366146 RepID=UPI00381CF040
MWVTFERVWGEDVADPTDEGITTAQAAVAKNMGRWGGGGRDRSPPGRIRGGRLAEAAYLGSLVTGDLRDAPGLIERARVAHPGPDEPLVATVATAHRLLHGDGDVDTAHRLLTTALGRHEQPTPPDDETDETGETDGADGTDDDLVRVEALHTLTAICFAAGRAELWPPLREPSTTCPHPHPHPHPPN